MSTTSQLAHTSLYDWHVAHAGRMVDFAGWSMPVQYTSISAEHLATRGSVGLFDISHMGRLRLVGPDAAEFLDHVVTRRIADMKPGQVRYALVCNESGGILDDVLVYRLPDDPAADGARSFQVVVNASNRAKIVAWFEARLAEFEVKMEDITTATAMIAIQGPQATGLVDPLVEYDLTSMRYYTGAETRFEQIDCFLSRTGYTGEDGCEIICPAANAQAIWDRLFEVGDELGVTAIGLGARDTLRLEAAMPLYGHELDEDINPIQAGLRFAVNLGEREFVGRAALKQADADSTQLVRVGLGLDGRRVPRQGCTVLHSDEPVGTVTSGTFSPTFDRPIAMAYVRPSAHAVGTHLAVDIRGTNHAAVVVPLPFYERGRSS